jgi:hypothetical protein
MANWPVVGFATLWSCYGVYALYRYAWKEPEVMEPTGLPGWLMRLCGCYESTLVRRLLVLVLAVALVTVGALVAWLGLRLEPLF